MHASKHECKYVTQLVAGTGNHRHKLKDEQQQQQPEASYTLTWATQPPQANWPIAGSPHQYLTHNALRPCGRASTGT